jgi:aerobic-type carbon monoxide dehydrogenase small subunit (CoxS/CutS family)
MEPVVYWRKEIETIPRKGNFYRCAGYNKIVGAIKIAGRNTVGGK